MSRSSLKALSEALAARLIHRALPGELQGFGPAEQTEAAAFLAATAERRPPGTVAIALEQLPGDAGARRQRLAIVNDDMPFLVDSIAAAIAAHDIAIDRIIHPVIAVTRDAEGLIKGVSDHEGTRESMIYIEMQRADARERRDLVSDIEAALADVRAAVSDWRAMQATLAADAGAIEDTGGSSEGATLMRWFLDRHFTLLGHERWYADGRGAGDALGIARNAHKVPLLAARSLELAMDYFAKGGEAPLMLKSSLISLVHRRMPIDLIIVPLREGGRNIGLSIHAGLWTSAALSAPPRAVPVLRQRLADLEGKFGFDPAGHTGKALAHAMGALPHDLVIAFDAESLERLALIAMSIADRPRPKLVLVRSPLGRQLFGFVWLPRDELTTARRVAIGEMIAESAGGAILNWTVAMEDGNTALIRYTVDLRTASGMPDEQALDAQLEKMVRGWVRDVEAALMERVPAQRAARLSLRWAAAFPMSYRTVSTAEEAAEDVLRLAELDGPGDRQVRLDPVARADERRLKIYKTNGALALSDAVPVLENFGFRVIGEWPTQMREEADSYVHDFSLEAKDADSAVAKEVLEGAVAAVLKGEAENDEFNRLILDVGLAPDAVVLLRAWFRYLRQAGMSYGLVTVVDALGRAPAVTRALIERFTFSHKPGAKGDEAAIEAAIEAGLEAVSAIDDDRILRAYRAVIGATLRTNAFTDAGREALAFKLDSARIPGLPAPLPWREVWVYSPRVEGIHLRAGPVARGGLRWSDRRDDFRTEILGLMKAQRVKNAVIVPTGAKGGFYPKQLPNPAVDRDAWLAEGTESYRIFIRTLLSITDNIVGGKVVHPKGVAIHDGDDPYFVVAADKGTATFSDVANAIALERDFWLGDAFASGGSHGYDHKAMGITAKGAWISVQRHFAERGVDVQNESIRVVGCGDMSGDVFGNGMLLSKTLKIVAAYDHRHIFLDPDPDPAASWDERARLFALPRSSWDDYDKALISKGGGVFPRSAKSIRLTPEVKAALDIAADELEPAALISAILRSPVDLIWFGGIGTYIKAAAENNANVGDPANDRLRVDAEELRAIAVGEGANLGVTQAGRIAFAARGGRINTDFIDNSAGVDCSDNEVNIKIALNREMMEKRLSFEDRNALLGTMTDDVAHLVLEDNRLQTLALSIAEGDGARGLPSYVRLIEMFEDAGKLDRKVEGLASNDDLLRRGIEGRGLTRPELAVLLATAKLSLQDAIERAPLATDAAMKGDLQAAFPAAMQEKFGKAIDEHRLRGEIVATKLANRIVNRIGVLHPFELAEEEGAALSDIAAMFVVVERLLDLSALWREIETTAMPESGRLALFDEVAAATRSQIADLLRVTAPGTAPEAVLKRIGKGVANLDAHTRELLLEEARAQSGRITSALEAAGAPVGLVAKVARLFELDGAIGLADLSERLGLDEMKVTKAFTRLGQALGLDWAQTTAARITSSDPWERLLIAGLARDFQQLRLDFLARGGKGDPAKLVGAWLDANAPRVAQFKALVDRARHAPAPNAAMLAQIAGQARVLLGR
ncbi:MULTISPECIES: NAD-glutamate dehydrogenase domain-containing protein [unclassified Sphingomonas]|uniref:NAD-glutamate dehydrogenase n=1 Tax=unclassified Sphingomonas TaxID=196159 RepID=UPI00092AED75|nr:MULTISPECIES: NAD-glutamate dehydrogenase domain-containing protein [unclassified Sphingomonas]MBN8847414.1 NAD-glutamate dehydrogenase [Sphingomonas sp.]OJV32333.1 MAG: glutamate dehydrogenase [Sphingomonas sp. 67-36]